MKRILFNVITSIILLGTAATSASAQRTSFGKAFAGVSQFVSVCSVPSGGIGLEGGQYLESSFWKAGIRAVDWNQKVRVPSGGEPGVFDHVIWTLSGGWMYRLAASYSRSFCLYAGGGAFVGINEYEVLRRLPAETEGDFPKAEFVYGAEGDFPKAEFVYGAEAALEAEFFPFRRVAFVLGIQSPLTFGSSLGSDFWHISASLGIRINL